MKKLLLVIMALAAQISFAQTDVVVTPKYPTSCEGQDQRKIVNWIYDMENVAEDEATVTFKYTTMYGPCIDGKPTPAPSNVGTSHVLLWKKGLTLFGKDPYKISLSQAEATSIEVTMVFEKKKVFKNGEVMKDYALQYFPLGTFPSRIHNGYLRGGSYFPWKIKLIKHDDFETKMMMIQ